MQKVLATKASNHYPAALQLSVHYRKPIWFVRCKLAGYVQQFAAAPYPTEEFVENCVERFLAQFPHDRTY